MSATKTSVHLELAFRPLTIWLEKPAELFPDDFDSWRLAYTSHALSVLNSRGLTPDDAAVLAQLGDPREFVQQALTNNRRCCWVGEAQVGAPWTLRQPVGDQLWYLILRDGGLEPIRKITSEYMLLFPDVAAAKSLIHG
jgi:hypothetical protein